MMKRFAIVAAFAILISLVVATAQEKEETNGIFETRQDYYEFMGAVKTSAQRDPELRAMIPLINDIVLNQEIGSTGRKYGGVSSSLGLLSDPAVRRELEVVDDQFEQLQQRNAEIQKRVAAELRDFDFAGDNVVQRIQAIRIKARKDVESILLPHQMARLRQLLMQTLLRRRSLADVLASDPFKSELELTDAQSEKLKADELRIGAELQKQIAELRAKARKELIETLQPAQQKEVESLFGDTFEFSSGKDTERSKQAADNGSKS